MRKVRKPNSVFRQEDLAEQRSIVTQTIRERRLKGEKIERTSFAIHGCNRCPTCTGKCPT
jgi:heterodisulfide reductase subunit C